MEALKNLLNRMASRTFLVFVITTVLYVMKGIGIEQYLTINGISYGGTSIKDLVSKTSRPETEGK